MKKYLRFFVLLMGLLITIPGARAAVYYDDGPTGIFGGFRVGAFLYKGAPGVNLQISAGMQMSEKTAMTGSLYYGLAFNENVLAIANGLDLYYGLSFAPSRHIHLDLAAGGYLGYGYYDDTTTCGICDVSENPSTRGLVDAGLSLKAAIHGLIHIGNTSQIGIGLVYQPRFGLLHKHPFSQFVSLELGYSAYF